MIKSLLSGFSISSIITNLIISGLLGFCVWALSETGPSGYFALPFLILLVFQFAQYCFITGKEAVYGAQEPPILKFESIITAPVPAIFSILCYGLYVLFDLLLGESYAIIVLGFLLPVLISSFFIEDEVLRAINPLNWLRYIIELKLIYFVLSLILVISALLLNQIPSGLWLWPKLFVYQTILVSTCFSIGHLLHQQRIELNIIAPETEEERDIRITSESDSAEFEKCTDRLFRLSEVHEYQKALKELLEYLSEKDNQLEYAIRIMDELMVWRNPALSAKFAPHYIQLLFEHNKPGKAFGVYQSIVKRYGPISISEENIRMAMIQFANEAGDYELAESLTQSA